MSNTLDEVRTEVVKTLLSHNWVERDEFFESICQLNVKLVLGTSPTAVLLTCMGLGPIEQWKLIFHTSGEIGYYESNRFIGNADWNFFTSVIQKTSSLQKENKCGWFAEELATKCFQELLYLFCYGLSHQL